MVDVPGQSFGQNAKYSILCDTLRFQLCHGTAKGTYSVKHVGVEATTPDRLCSIDPKRRTSLNTYGEGNEDLFRCLSQTTKTCFVSLVLPVSVSPFHLIAASPPWFTLHSFSGRPSMLKTALAVLLESGF